MDATLLMRAWWEDHGQHSMVWRLIFVSLGHFETWYQKSCKVKCVCYSHISIKSVKKRDPKILVNFGQVWSSLVNFGQTFHIVVKSSKQLIHGRGVHNIKNDVTQQTFFDFYGPWLFYFFLFHEPWWYEVTKPLFKRSVFSRSLMGESRRVGRFKKSINQKCFEGGEAAFCVMNGVVMPQASIIV